MNGEIVGDIHVKHSKLKGCELDKDITKPKDEGKFKIIYIDPPYNTGAEEWIYNDNVESPIIKKWLGKVVGIDDLTRHDKWLCMMYPRLKLLKELLSDDGVIFISIDDFEIYNLRNLMNEIFGEDIVAIRHDHDCPPGEHIHHHGEDCDHG